jgi:ATP-dependent exoDNAse (exonuclease V) alpha subunit
MDEAGMAPTRETAVLLEAAERAGAKVIGAGDVGQLPSVQAGGWFDAIALKLGGPRLRTVIRQRDPGERAALEALHDAHASVYIEFKEQQRALTVHDDQDRALSVVLDSWDRARVEHGLGGAVMIARDNATRARLNEAARARLIRHGTLAAQGS